MRHESTTMKDGNIIHTDHQGRDFVFVPNGPDMMECIVERHNATVRITWYVNRAPSKYYIRYKSKAQKSFRTQAVRESFQEALISTEKLFASFHKKQCLKEEQKIADKKRGEEFLAQLKVGTILVSSWGYSMTIVDFYKVKEINGKKITLVGLCNKYESESRVLPSDQEDGNIKVCMIRSGDSLKINSSSSAWIWDGKSQYENRND